MKQHFPSLIPYRRGELWGYSDQNKNIVIDLRYDQAFPFVESIAIVVKDGLYGVVNTNGEEVLPTAYESIENPVIGSFTNEEGTCSIYHEAKFGLISIKGDLLAEVIYATHEEALLHAESKGWRGAVALSYYPEFPSESGETIEALGEFVGGFAIYKKDGVLGIVSQNGEKITDPKYDAILPPENGYWPFQKNGMWGLLDAKGNETIRPSFEQVRGFSNGQAACQSNGLWGAIDLSGEWVIPPQYTELGEFRDGLSAAQQNGLFGFIDESGNTIIGFQYEDVMDFDEGVCAVFEGDDAYFIDTSGNNTSEKYVRLFGPNENGLIHVMKEEKWGLVKTNGQFVLPIQYDPPRAMGQVLHTIEDEFIPIKKGPLLGFATMEGRELVSPKYMSVDPYCEGLSLVSVLDDGNSFGDTPESIEMTGSISGLFKFGFLDRNGNEVIKPKYNLAHRFEKGLAFVQSTFGGSGYVTYDGTEYFEDN